MKRIRILLADDHTIVLDGFKRLLEPTFEVVGLATTGQELLKLAQRTHPDIVVADIAMPLLNGLDACEKLRAELPGVKLIFITASEDAEVAAEAIRRGAMGFLQKKSAASELFEAIRRVAVGEIHVSSLVTREPTGVFVARARQASPAQELSLRQREVLQLLAEGRSMKEAADILQVAPRTIAFHKYSMMEQLGLKTSAELVQHAVKLGLVAGRNSASF